jgi:hypothetical protein
MPLVIAPFEYWAKFGLAIIGLAILLSIFAIR